MRIPRSVEILGRRFSIAVVDVVAPKGDLAGQILYAPATIRIDRSYDHAGQERIMLHECLHSINNELDLGLDENGIRRLTVATWDLIKRNRLWFGQGDPS